MTCAWRTQDDASTRRQARRYVMRLLRQGEIDLEAARFQLAAIDAAARAGRRVLIVGDLDSATADRLVHHAA